MDRSAWFYLLVIEENGAGAHRQAEPLVAGVAQVGRDIGGQHLRLHRLERAFPGGFPQVAGVHRDQHVRRGILALGLEALQQCAFLVGDELDLDAGFLGVGIEHRLDQLLVAGGIDNHFIGQHLCGESGKGDAEQGAEAKFVHLQPPAVGG